MTTKSNTTEDLLEMTQRLNASESGRPVLTVLRQAALVAARRKLLGSWSVESVDVTYCCDGRSARRVVREAVATGLVTASDDAPTLVRLSPLGWQWAQAQATQPTWPDWRTNGRGISSQWGSLLWDHWVWLALNADQTIWTARVRGTEQPYEPGTAVECASEFFVQSRAVIAEMRRAADAELLESTLRQNLGAVLVALGILSAGDEDAVQSSERQVRLFTTPPSWTAQPSDRCANEIEVLRNTIAHAERRLRIVAALQERVAYEGGWDVVMACAREYVEDYLVRLDADSASDHQQTA